MQRAVKAENGRQMTICCAQSPDIAMCKMWIEYRYSVLIANGLKMHYN